MANSQVMETAEKFFFECENGAGWKGCQQYCHPEATFSSEAKTLADVNTLENYIDWMVQVYERISNISYSVEGMAHDEGRNVVMIYGIFCGEAPEPFQLDYVYVLKFSGNKISHLTKVYQSDQGMGCTLYINNMMTLKYPLYVH